MVKLKVTDIGTLINGVSCRTAQEVEAIVRAEGANPATVGVIHGRVHVGLSSKELDYLARSKTSLKVSRRDLPFAISKVRPRSN